MSDIDRLRQEYEDYKRHGECAHSYTTPLGVSKRADAVIAALEAEVEQSTLVNNRLRVSWREDVGSERDRAEQAEAEVALRDRMLRDIIERIALTPERWNGWTTEDVLADLRARAQEAER